MWLKLLRWNPPRRSSSRSLRRRNLSRSIKSTAEMSTRNWRSTKQVHSLCLEIWELVFLSFVFSRTRRGFFCRMIFKNAIFDYSGIWKLWPSLNRSARYRRPLPSSSAATMTTSCSYKHKDDALRALWGVAETRTSRSSKSLPTAGIICRWRPCEIFLDIYFCFPFSGQD